MILAFEKKKSKPLQLALDLGRKYEPIRQGDNCRLRGSTWDQIGGGGESRTPVRKQLDWNFSGRSPLFTFPHPDGNGHPAGFGSFMMHGAGKAYRTHGLHSNHTRARLVDLPGRMGA